MADKLEIFKRYLFYLDDTLFEKLHRLQLGGIISHDNLILYNNSNIHATAYYACWCRNLREIFSEAKKTGIDFEGFIDIGAGKGKACFFAYKKMKFKKILGIEFSTPIIDVAHLNNKKFQGDKRILNLFVPMPVTLFCRLVTLWYFCLTLSTM